MCQSQFVKECNWINDYEDLEKEIEKNVAHLNYFSAYYIWRFGYDQERDDKHVADIWQSQPIWNKTKNIFYGTAPFP